MVVSLGDARARSVDLAGGKAAALARAEGAGLATLGGRRAHHRVLRRDRRRRTRSTGHPAVAEAFQRAGGDRAQPGGPQLVGGRGRGGVVDGGPVRRRSSASTGFDAFAAAVQHGARLPRSRPARADEPIAVLVQPLIEPAFGGVMFGIDPVTGRSDRRIVVGGAGRPRTAGQRRGRGLALRARRAGEVARVRRPSDGPELPTATSAGWPRCRTRSPRCSAGRRTSSGRSARTASCGCCSRARSRPRSGASRGARSTGPGPVAETFPEPLTELERDLWVPPLREAVARGGAARRGRDPGRGGRRATSWSPIDGHVAIDLRLAGEIRRAPRRRSALNPVRGVRRHAGGLAGRAAAGRAARARRAPARPGRRRPRGGARAARADQPPAHRPAAPQPDDAAGAARPRDPDGHAHRHRRQPHDRRVGGAAGAGRGPPGRAHRRGDPRRAARSCWRWPRPGWRPRPELPPRGDAPSTWAPTHGDSGNDNGILREALRLRVRWIQELSGRAAWALGERLAAAGELDRARPDPAHEPRARRGRRHQAGRGRAARWCRRTSTTSAHPLPAWFQLSDLGKPIRVAVRAPRSAAAPAPAAARPSARSPTTPTTRPPGSVLVTTTLTPALGPLLPRLSGIVPRPARCCRTSRSSPARPGWPRSSATPARTSRADLPRRRVGVRRRRRHADAVRPSTIRRRGGAP